MPTLPPFVPHAERVSAEGAVPSRWMLFLHGVFGSGANWRPFARKLVGLRPSWGALLVDLRAHGESYLAPPPHTVAIAAEDLRRLESSLGLPIGGAVGHSFGGKVALAYAERHGGDLEQVWLLDAPAGPKNGAGDDAMKVLAVLDAVPQPLASRAEFVDLVTPRVRGRAVADWLAMSLRQETGGGYRLRYDLAAIRALLDDYYRLDLRSVADEVGLGGALHVVVGGQSDVVSAEERERLGRAGPVHVLARAGHWVQSDDPDGLLEVMAAALAP